jgi:uncharacterized protein YuzE
MTTKVLHIEYDLEANALYFKLDKGKFSKTIELNPTMYLDVDKEGRPLGLEVLDARAFLDRMEYEKGQLELPPEVSQSEAVRLFLDAVA